MFNDYIRKYLFKQEHVTRSTKRNALTSHARTIYPSKLQSKKAIINIQNEEDNECFKWCILRHLHPDKNPQRVSSLKRYEDELTFSDIDFPMKLSDITKFEKQNNIYVNVYGYEKDTVYPLRFSKNRDVVDLLLISSAENNHYCLIKDLSRLVSMQASKHKTKIFLCRNCMQHFNKDDDLTKHEEDCWKNDSEKIVMPEVKIEEGEKITPSLSFKNHKHREKVPFIVYVDFEALVELIEGCEKNPNKSFTNQYQKHKPCGFCYHIKCFDESIYPSKTVYYRMKSGGEDISQIFVDMLEKDILQIHKEFDFSKPMIFTKADKANFTKATTCWICSQPFEGYDKKARDHCHFTGKYRGAAHNSCNLKYKKPNFTPVIFHNLTGYDSHLFVKNLGKSKGDINCIPNNEGKIHLVLQINRGWKIHRQGRERERYQT